MPRSLCFSWVLLAFSNLALRMWCAHGRKCGCVCANNKRRQRKRDTSFEWSPGLYVHTTKQDRKKTTIKMKRPKAPWEIKYRLLFCLLLASPLLLCFPLTANISFPHLFPSFIFTSLAPWHVTRLKEKDAFLICISFSLHNRCSSLCFCGNRSFCLFRWSQRRRLVASRKTGSFPIFPNTRLSIGGHKFLMTCHLLYFLSISMKYYSPQFIVYIFYIPC